jgi:hypothetical protein
MPLFFYISGLSTTFFKTERDGFVIYLKGKIMRLLLPMVLACLTLLVPRLYLSQEYEPWTRINDKIENNFFVYLWHVIPLIPARLSWLWFLIVLFVVMILSYPLLAFSVRRKQRMPFNLFIDGKIIAGQLLTLSLWAIPCKILVSENDAYKYTLPSITVLLLFYGTMFIIQFAFTWFTNGYKLALYAKLIGLICCIIMNFFKYGTYDNGAYSFLMAI